MIGMRQVMIWIRQVIVTSLKTLLTFTRRIAAVGLLGCLMLAFVPIGCGSRLGPVTATHAQSDGHPPVPRATVERLKACMEEYREQLAPGSHSIHLVIKTDKNGVKRRVTENDIPNSAPEFASCARQALREMEIPAEFFRLAEDMEKKTQGDVSKAQRSNVGSPLILVVAVAIGLSELVLEAGAYTILFAISVELLNEAVKDVADSIDESDGHKRQCDAELTACLLTPLADLEGHIHGSSRCVMCWLGCTGNNGVWPYRMMKGTRSVTCKYW